MPVIFVYGSLKRDKRLNYYLKDAKFLGEAVTCNRYPLVISKSGWYPYLLEKRDGERIKGEVYKVSFKTLKILDRVEEVPNYYYRKRVCVKSKRALFAWVYFAKKHPKYTKRELLKEF